MGRRWHIGHLQADVRDVKRECPRADDYADVMDADHLIAADRAIDWAMEWLGSPAYATRCLAFVEDAVERANDIEIFGGDDASESAAIYDAGSRTTAPTRGAFAFYRAEGVILGRRRDWGHVGLSVGDGTVIHAWDRVRRDDYRDVPLLPAAPGWEQPVWLGWVPLGRVLEGSRARAWTTDPASAAQSQQRQHIGGGD
jgi:cell wall-associated NlpC family hydrolase